MYKTRIISAEEKHKRSSAFTLAEVLITIAIVGIVAALTIPSIISSYKDKQYNTARLKALKTFGEAGKMTSINDEMNSETNATDFVNNVLSKYLKITKVCNNNKASECNFPEYIKRPSDVDDSWTKYNPSNNFKSWNNLHGYIGTANNASIKSDTNLSIYVNTADGFSAKIFYNPNCIRNDKELPYVSGGAVCYNKNKECANWAFDTACMNVIYDMNGRKNPNRMGEDVGIVTVFWSGLKSTAVAPGVPPNGTNSTDWLSFQDAVDYCASKSSKGKHYSIPNIDEASSIGLNYQFAPFPSGINQIWSGTKGSSNMWVVHANGVVRSQSYYGGTYCVRR